MSTESHFLTDSMKCGSEDVVVGSITCCNISRTYTMLAKLKDQLQSLG